MKLTEILSEYAEVRLHEPMKYHTTYRIGGPADYYIKPYRVLDLIQVLNTLFDQKIPFLILGKGSNVLVSDAPYHGVVIDLRNCSSLYAFDEQGILTAQAGCSLPALSALAAEKSLSGLEFANGIPGSIGGGIYMNAGAYKTDLSEILIDVLIWDEGRIVRRKKEELDYSYRHSAFQSHPNWVVLEARFQLTVKDQEQIKERIDKRRERRNGSQPVNSYCAGSVFRNLDSEILISENPLEKTRSAWVIVDRLGFRNMREGGAMVSGLHTNFIINEHGQASAADVDCLIQRIQQAAKAKYGIDLITEIERINWDAQTKGKPEDHRK